jgi:hypothetical protein
MFEVKKAKRQRRPLKVSMEGLSGQGKTYTALRMAFDMRRHGIGSKIVVLDSENESAGLYAGTREDGETWDYDTVDMPQAKRNPAGYTEAYDYLARAGFDIIIIDSLSHAWHGAMEQVDNYARQNKGDKFGAWATVTPDQRKMLQTLTDQRAHCISTMRVKSDMQDQEVRGKMRKVKVGTKADQREGTEYEYDLVLRFEMGNECIVDKVRGCSAMNGLGATKPGPAFWKPLFDWWLSAEPTVSAANQLTADLTAADTEEKLKTAWGAWGKALKAGTVTQEQYNAAAAIKDQRKAAIATWAAPQPPAAPEADEHGVPLFGAEPPPRATNMPD